MGELVSKNYEWAICITHDVDHLFHKINWDGVKFLGVCALETLYFKRSLSSFINTAWNFSRKPDSWNRTLELADLNKRHRIPATYFLAVKKGRGIEYSVEDAKPVIEFLRNAGFEIGVHGQAYDDFELVKKENETMKNILEEQPLGIRMHYLKFDKEKTPGFLNEFYSYDSSEYSKDLKQPYLISKKLVEIPLHIMDTYLFSPFYKNFTLEQAQKYTLEMIKKTKIKKSLLVINFHQRSLSYDFPRHRAYYLWLLSLISKDKKCLKVSCKEIAKGFL